MCENVLDLAPLEGTLQCHKLMAGEGVSGSFQDCPDDLSKGKFFFVNPLGMAHCVPFYDDRALAGQTTTVDKGAMQSGANKNYANEFGGMTTKAQVHLRANHSPLPVANSSPVVTTQGGAPERRV